jgi:Cu/Zn superoxide dismutase
MVGTAGAASLPDAVAVGTLATTGVDPEHSGITGTATFTQIGNDVTLVLELEGCPAGPHVSHIHENPSCGDEGNAAGGHWLPNGELIEDYNCDAEGNASYTLTVDGGRWTIGAGDEETDVDGHAFMVHMGSSAAPGDRVACGVIERQ